MQLWKPEMIPAALGVMEEIRKTIPGKEVLLGGSTALGIPGAGDIDLDILCPKEEIVENEKKLAHIFGEPTEKTDMRTKWVFEKNGFHFDCVLSDPKISHFPMQRRVFEALQSNPDLMEEYRGLKINCDGLPYEQYETKKKEFFQKVLAV